jgi:S1-C subfamily serine protease
MPARPISRTLVCLLAVVLMTGCSGPAPPAESADARATIEALNLEVARLRATATPVVATPAMAPATATTPPTAAVPTAAPTATPATIPSPTALTLEDAIALVKRYTVFIRTDLGSGSGVSLGRGRVVTNYHVVEGATIVNVRFADGRQEQLRVVRVDSRRDLALLETSFTELPAASLRDERGLRDGESLLAVGYPRSDAIGARDPTVTRGILSGRWQSPQGVWHVQTDTPANPGNSGGPLADTQGNVVGLVTFGIRQAVGLNFAIASDEVRAFLSGGDTGGAAPAVVSRPELSVTRISPDMIAPGGVLTFEYEITYDGNPVTVVLGASIRLPGAEWINDPFEDIRVELRSRRARFTRQFHVPATAVAGRYDVAWGLLGTDMRTSYGLVTQPMALVVGAVGVGLPSPQAGGGLQAALARIAQEGYRVADTSTYDRAAPIRVLVGVASSSADGSIQRAFFFAGDRYLGTDALEPSASVQVVRQAVNVVTLRYALYRPADAVCCPSAGTADVRYRWDGTRLEPLDAIPSSDPRAAVSRR